MLCLTTEIIEIHWKNFMNTDSLHGNLQCDFNYIYPATRDCVSAKRLEGWIYEYKTIHTPHMWQPFDKKMYRFTMLNLPTMLNSNLRETLARSRHGGFFLRNCANFLHKNILNILKFSLIRFYHSFYCKLWFNDCCC